MSLSTIFTIIILAVLLLILTSLGFGLFYLLKPGDNNGNVVKALSFRVGLSMMLFLGILFAINQGWIVPSPPPL